MPEMPLPARKDGLAKNVMISLCAVRAFSIKTEQLKDSRMEILNFALLVTVYLIIS
jgi:hypothetical protein